MVHTFCYTSFITTKFYAIAICTELIFVVQYVNWPINSVYFQLSPRKGSNSAIVPARFGFSDVFLQKREDITTMNDTVFKILTHMRMINLFFMDKILTASKAKVFTVNYD